MYGYIYKTTNLVNGKIYVGKKEKEEFDPTYYGSGLLLQKALDKYGKENFKVELIEFAESLNELNKKEREWIKYYSLPDFDIGYNIAEGGDGGNLIKHYSNIEKKEYIDKIRKANKNKKVLINIKTKQLKHIPLIEVNNYLQTKEWEFYHPKVIINDSTKKLMSLKAKQRKPNTKGKIRICLPDGSNQKYVTPEDFKNIFEKRGFIKIYYVSKKYKNKIENKAQKYYQSKKQTILMRKKENEKAIFVKLNEVEKYLAEGYFRVNNNKGRKHNPETISKMRHSHKKMKDTSNIAYARTKWIYTYKEKDFYGIVKIWEFIRTEGYSISKKGIDNIIDNKLTTCIKYPDLVGKIKKRLKSKEVELFV